MMMVLYEMRSATGVIVVPSLVLQVHLPIDGILHLRFSDACIVRLGPVSSVAS